MDERVLTLVPAKTTCRTACGARSAWGRFSGCLDFRAGATVTAAPGLAFPMEDFQMFKRISQTQAPAAVLLIRLAVGLIFLSEGIQKFLFPEQRGVGRFTSIGLPEPEFLAYFVAVFEVVCGTLVVVGLLTRPAVTATITIMLVAIATTKFPMLAADGFWEAAHAARTDFAMLMSSLFLLVVGAGRWSFDGVLSRSPRS